MNEQQDLDINEAAADNSWLSGLPEELKGAPSLLKFKDIPTLARSYLEAEKALNGRVAIPKDDASEEEWAKFYSRLGLPEDKKYLDQRSPEDEEHLQTYEEMFYNNGISKRQGAKLLDSMYKLSTDLQKKQQEEVDKSRESNVDWLKSNYGDLFDNKITTMQAALTKYGTRELAGLIEETGYSPALVDLLVRVGETLRSDSLVTGNQVTTINTAESAKLEIKKLESDREFMVKLRDKNHAAHSDAVKKLEELYKVAYDNKK